MATIDDVTKSVDDANSRVDALQNKINNLKVGVFFDNAIKAMKDYSTFMIKMETDTSSWERSTSKSFDAVANAMTKYMTLMTTFEPFKKLRIDGGAAISTLSTQFDELVVKYHGIGNVAKLVGGDMYKAFEKNGEEGVRSLINHASAAQETQNAYLSLMASQGRLGEVYAYTGGSLNKLNDLTGVFTKQIDELHVATGYTTNEISQFISKTKDIPRIMDEIISGVGGATDKATAFEAVLKLAQGAGIDASIAFNVVEKAIEDLGNATGKVTDGNTKGYKMFSLMSEASNSLGLRFKDTKGYLEHAADTFKLMGDNTQAATNILTKFSGALQATGLTASQSVAVISDMVESIGKLDMGTKALISSRNGGPGGLQGAFRIENLARRGNIDEIAKMMEQMARRQFGGRIYTQAEAEQSPQAAANFMRQRTMLQSSAFGQWARSPEAASHLLEAMKQGPVATKEAIKDAMNAQKAGQKIAGRGDDLIKQSNTLLNDLNNKADTMIGLTEQSLKMDVTDVIGTTGNTKYGEQLKKNMDNASYDLVHEAASPEKKEFKQTLTEANRRAVGGVANIVSNTPEIAGKAGKLLMDEANELGSAVKEGIKSFGDMADVEEVKKQQELSRQAVQNGRRTQTMHAAANQAMRQHPRTMASAMPKMSDVVTHKVEVKPLEVHVTVSRDPGTEVETTTNYPDANIKNVVNQQVKGYHSVVKP